MIDAINITPSVKYVGGIGNVPLIEASNVSYSVWPYTKKYFSLSPSPTVYNVCFVYWPFVNGVTSVPLSKFTVSMLD